MMEGRTSQTSLHDVSDPTCSCIHCRLDDLFWKYGELLRQAVRVWTGV